MTAPRRGRDGMPKIAPCLWFGGGAEEAARFYVSLLPGSRVGRVQQNPADGPASASWR